ncbi:uncharacterized protein A1O5_01995 [Cladophialophora psammophila CBS 110553]|uniref:Dynamin GTPase n=1 Tax=Cladophialophora psammophila CBS 110553 TaxID=1182543 RepID=W9XYC5_9EURO|nr:uncharacterized protein A1O5_01995 [Cladophialophora psammophila CBS 110553]EXJ75299.1 hypothetical protein A1O5_01995 [Cladophialophora psammophila CBS 110553]
MAYQQGYGTSTPDILQTPTVNGYVDVPNPFTDRLRSLQSQEEKRLFELVDRLKDLDVNRELQLPQLVVCGSQSSGKSSVLEAISGLSFPRGEFTCTKFVTELRFRPGNVESINIEIVPDTGRSPDDQARLRNARFKSRRLSELGQIVKEAEKWLLGGRGGFASDVLKVEVVRPHQQPLTLIDTPGLIASHNEGREYIDLVRRIVDDWIKQPRTLILAVVEANLDPQKQSVLTIAKEVDPTGERTFGIITKPDLVESPSGLEDFWVKKAQNGADSMAEFNFAKGWHVLRNRGVRETGNETSTAERDEAERMFFMSPERRWSQVDQAFWGIESLQGRLRSIYYDHTRRQLPIIQDDILHRLQKAMREVDGINEKLADADEIWSRFCGERTGLAVQAKGCVDGTYLDGLADWDGAPDYYLRSRIEEDHDEFAREVELNGHGLRQVKSARSLTEDRDGFRTYVQQMLESTRGRELKDSYDPNRLNLLFRKHSEPWYGIAMMHLDRAHRRCVAFVEHIIENVLRKELPAVPTRVSQAIKDHLYQALEKQKKKAEDELKAIEQDRRQPAQTQSRRFEKLARQLKADRNFALVNRVAEEEDPYMANASPTKTESLNERENIMPPPTPGSATRFTPAHVDRVLAQDSRAESAEEIGKRMIIYYEIAREVFIDNVVVQVVERHLLRPLHTLFQGDFGVDKDVFTRAVDAERDQNLTARRNALNERIKRLKAFDDQLRAI